MSTEQFESAPAAVTAPQVQTKAAPAADVTQQATTPTTITQLVKKTPSVWPPEKWLPKERGLPEKNRRKRPRLITRKRKEKPPQRPVSQLRLPKAKAQRAKAQRAAAFLASAPTNGLVLAA